MADTGAIYPGTAATESVLPEDDSTWGNPNNIKADDGSNATAGLDDEYIYSYRLKATNFGFSLPAGATIDGILVEIERSASAATVIDCYRVQLLDAAGALVGDNKADVGTFWTTTPTIKEFGGATDKWNATPTEAMVEDADFGVVLTFHNGISYSVAQVDFIRMTVYYTVAVAYIPSRGFYPNILAH